MEKVKNYSIRQLIFFFSDLLNQRDPYVNSLLLVKHSNFECTCFQGRIYGCISQYLFKYKKYVTDVVVLCYFGAKLFLSCSK